MFYVKSKSTHSIVIMYTAHHSNIGPHKNAFEISMGLALESLWVLRALRIFMVLGSFSSAKGPSVSPISMSMCVYDDPITQLQLLLARMCCGLQPVHVVPWSECAGPLASKMMFFRCLLRSKCITCHHQSISKHKTGRCFCRPSSCAFSGQSKARSSVSLYQTFTKDQSAIVELEVRTTEHWTFYKHTPQSTYPPCIPFYVTGNLGPLLHKELGPRLNLSTWGARFASFQPIIH